MTPQKTPEPFDLYQCPVCGVAVDKDDAECWKCGVEFKGDE